MQAASASERAAEAEGKAALADAERRDLARRLYAAEAEAARQQRRAEQAKTKAAKSAAKAAKKAAAASERATTSERAMETERSVFATRLKAAELEAAAQQKRADNAERRAQDVEAKAALFGIHGGEIVVGPGARVMDAVRSAKTGQTILLAPGRYYEQMTLDKDVRIVGPREAVLEWDQGVTLHCSSPAAPSVKGITIRCSAPTHCAVWITDGSRAAVEGCDVSSAGLNGIEVCDAGTASTLHGNAVHDCGAAGILFHESAKGVAEGNDVYGNASSGIQISDGADPVVLGNKVRDGKQVGIVVWNNGRGTVEGNDVYGNAKAGIQILGGADPVVRGNRIHDQQWGILVHRGGKGTVAGNTLERLGCGEEKAIDVAPDCAGCRLEGNTVR
eukprot:tig00000157_g9681.t1